MNFKIIHSCTSQSFSGLEKYVLDLASWQYDQGFDIELFCRDGSELSKEAAKRGVPLWHIGAHDKKGLLLWSKMAAQWSQRFKSAHEQEKKIILHMHASGEPWFHLPWTAIKNKVMHKVILQYHLWINHKKKDPLHAAVYNGIDEVWCSSESARAHLSTLLPVDREKITVINYGRDLQVLQKYNDEAYRLNVKSKLRSEFGISPTAVMASCVSRIEPIKGIGELFEAYSSIAHNFPDFHLIVVGDVSPNNKEAEQFAEMISMKHQDLPPPTRDRLHFTGYRKDSLDIVAASDFYILPSYEECMSLALLDALIIGVPVLGTTGGGTPSVVRPQETGWLVKPADSSDLTLTLEKVLQEFKSQPQKVHAYGCNARKLGFQFDSENIFKSVIERYRTDI